MSFDELTNDEEVVLDTFIELMKKIGRISMFTFFEKKLVLVAFVFIKRMVNGYLMIMKEMKKLDMLNMIIYINYVSIYLNLLRKSIPIIV